MIFISTDSLGLSSPSGPTLLRSRLTNGTSEPSHILKMPSSRTRFDLRISMAHLTARFPLLLMTVDLASKKPPSLSISRNLIGIWNSIFVSVISIACLNPIAFTTRLGRKFIAELRELLRDGEYRSFHGVIPLVSEAAPELIARICGFAICACLFMFIGNSNSYEAILISQNLLWNQFD